MEYEKLFNGNGPIRLLDFIYSNGMYKSYRPVNEVIEYAVPSLPLGAVLTSSISADLF